MSATELSIAVIDVHAEQYTMADASSVFLNGFRLRTEARIVRYPHRYMDERGQEMWDPGGGTSTTAERAQGAAQGAVSGTK